MRRQFNRCLPANTWDDIEVARKINTGATDTQLAIEAFALLRKYYEERERTTKNLPRKSDGLAEKIM